MVLTTGWERRSIDLL